MPTIHYNYNRGLRISYLAIQPQISLKQAEELSQLIRADLSDPLPEQKTAPKRTIFSAMPTDSGALDGLLFGAVRNTLVEIQDGEEDEALTSLRQLAHRSMLYSLPPERSIQLRIYARAECSHALHLMLAGDDKGAAKALEDFLDFDMADCRYFEPSKICTSPVQAAKFGQTRMPAAPHPRGSVN
jgi:hypothetical protein